MMNKMCYYDSDLRVFYYYNDNPKDITQLNYIDSIKYDGSYYKIVCLLSGDRIVQHNNERYSVSDDAIIIANSNTSFTFERTSNKTNCYLEIYMNNKLFNNIVGDDDYLRVFRYNSDLKVFYPKKFDNQICSMLIQSIIEALKLKLGRIHMLSKIYSLISELDVEFDKGCKNEFRGAENYNVKIMKYIENHFTERITLTSVCEKFHYSSTTINEIIKNNTGLTFLQFVNLLRTREAQYLLSNYSYSFKTIAEMCGYSDYSTFFRAYKKRFGISPAEYKDSLSKENNSFS